MTRKLLNQNLPKEIIRRTSELLSGDSLKRYEEITNIMVNEYGYVVTKQGVTDYGSSYWILKKDVNNDLNEEMGVEYKLLDLEPSDHIHQDMYNKVVSYLQGEPKDKYTQ